jgi:phage baseplate assembly protein V
MIDMIRKIVDPIARRANLMIGRAVLLAATDDGKRQFVQFEALKGEVKGDVERMQQYGFSSVPHPGAQVVFVCIGGNRDHPIAISVDDPTSRVNGLAAGEVAVYNSFGAKMVMKADGSIEITSAVKVRMITPLLQITGEIQDRCDTGGLSMHDMRGKYDAHKHGASPTTDTPMGG